MQYERVIVKRDSQTVYNRLVAPWEIPLLEFIFEEGNVERTGEFESNDFEYPDARVEFDRLSTCYGKNVENDIPHVGSVYGQSGAGVRALRTEIEKAKASAPKAAPKPRDRKPVTDADLMR